MADKLGQLYVEIIADNKKFDSGIDKSKKETEKFKGGLDGLSGTVKKLLGAGALIALAGKIIDVGKASISAASDAQETQNKFNVVFSGISDEANKMATNLATAYGTSITGAKDMLAGTGDLLTGLGFTQESAFSLSEQVLTLGSDLASFTNFSGGAEGASEALTKALLGEREMLKGLGISINEADVKAELLRQTEQGLTFETEKQAKAQATLNLVMSQTANAQGDFARSQDSFANQMKISKARTEDLQVELGRALLPTATKGIGIFGALTGKLGEYLKGLNDIREAEEAQKSGIATQEQELALLESKLTATQKDLDNQKKSMEATDARLLQAGIVKTEEEKANSLLGRNIAAKERQISAISLAVDTLKLEIKTKQDLQEETKKEEQLLIDKAETERQAAEARVIQKEIDLGIIDKVIEANKSEIDVIDEQIEQLEDITNLTESENQKRLESIRLLQTDKQAILDEEAEAEQKARDDKAKADEEANKKELEDAVKLKDAKIALKQEEADFVVGIAGSILSIYEGYNQGQIDSGKKTAEEIYDINVKQFRAEQALALSQIAIDTAIGVAKVYGQTGIFGIAAQVPVIAAGALQAAAVLAEQPPAKPALATGAIIPGTQRGVDVTVGEGGNDELILGGGAQGEAILQRFADKVNAGGGKSQTIVNINSLYPPRQQDLDRLFKDGYPSMVKEQQRRGI